MWKLIESKKLDIKEEFVIKSASKTTYNKLKQFHYINESLPIGSIIYGLFDKQNDIPYGVICYSIPSLAILGRNRSHLGKILKGLSKSKQTRFINRNLRVISRVIIHPSIRGIGLTPYLIENSRGKIPVRFIEINAGMLFYHNFLPKTYCNFVKVKVVEQSGKLFNIDSKSNTLSRTHSPIRRYGYGLFINKDVKPKLN